MKKRWIGGIGAGTTAILLSGLITVGSASAASIAGTDPGSALAPGDNAVTLSPGQDVWYSFQYTGDSSQIEALINDLQGSGVDFNVWTPEQVQQMQSGQQVDPIGRGTPGGDFGMGNLDWVGAFPEAGTYYVEVQNDSSANASITLDVAGSSVSIPQPQQPGIGGVGAAPQPAQPAQATQGGASPDQALAPTGAVATVNPGQSVWYAFQYAGDGSSVEAWINDLQGSVSFNVWTPGEMQQMASGQQVAPVGQGTPSGAYDPGNFSWNGSSMDAGTYYLQVHNDSSAPATFAIQIDGSGVTVPATQS